MDSPRLVTGSPPIAIAALVLLTALLLAVPRSAADGAENSDVLELTPANFYDHVGGDSVTFVKFYAPWCGHCQRLAPDWEKVATAFKDSDAIRIAKVDCQAHAELCTNHEVRGYPTLKWFPAAGQGGAEDYGGDRKANVFVDFINSRLCTKGRVETEQESRVMELTTWAFPSVMLDDTKHLFTYYYDAACKPCKEMTKGEESIVFAKVDADNNGMLAHRWGVMTWQVWHTVFPLPLCSPSHCVPPPHAFPCHTSHPSPLLSCPTAPLPSDPCRVPPPRFKITEHPFFKFFTRTNKYGEDLKGDPLHLPPCPPYLPACPPVPLLPVLLPLFPPSRFKITEYPFFKFFTKTNKYGEDLKGDPLPTLTDLVHFVNQWTGTTQSASGVPLDKVGRIAELDAMAGSFVEAPEAEKQGLMERAMGVVVAPELEEHGVFYQKVMKNIVEQGEEYVSKEHARLSKLLAGVSCEVSTFSSIIHPHHSDPTRHSILWQSLKPDKVEKLSARRNILEAFSKP
ncbi:unnamed protein product [Closterium sp. Naga37s-1]|nr:unnamed protein product [Closterium sp. Naga37s-1]